MSASTPAGRGNLLAVVHPSLITAIRLELNGWASQKETEGWSVDCVCWEGDQDPNDLLNLIETEVPYTAIDPKTGAWHTEEMVRLTGGYVFGGRYRTNCPNRTVYQHIERWVTEFENNTQKKKYKEADYIEAFPLDAKGFSPIDRAIGISPIVYPRSSSVVYMGCFWTRLTACVGRYLGQEHKSAQIVGEGVPFENVVCLSDTVTITINMTVTAKGLSFEVSGPVTWVDSISEREKGALEFMQAPLPGPPPPTQTPAR